MARIRTIKPEFFKNEPLSELKADVRLLFVGLWTMADREGRLTDRPKRIKADIFPYENMNVEKGLKELAAKGFIVRYSALVANVEEKLIQINNFLKHQRPHIKELPSTYPAPTQHLPKPGSAPTQTVASTSGREGKGMDKQEGEGNGDGEPTTPPEEILEPIETEEENDPPSPPPPLNALELQTVDKCFERYFSEPLFDRTREMLCMQKSLSPEMLKEWGKAFCRHLIASACIGKFMNDFATHFKNWLGKQNLNLNPQTIDNNEQGTTKNGQQQAGGRNLAYKEQLAKRMAGDGGIAFDEPYTGA